MKQTPNFMVSGPNGVPESKGTIKETVGVDSDLFVRQLKWVDERRSSWLADAADSKPQLFRTAMMPISLVMSQKDVACFQGWKMVSEGPPESVLNKPLLPGTSFILDFGEHMTGQLVFSLRAFDIPVDAPVRLAMVFGEMPAEVSEPLDSYTGWLARSWIQDEVFNFDDVPQTVTLPRRYAFRYVKVTVVSASKHGTFGFSDIHAEAITSADERKLLPFTPRSADEATLDEVSRRTLRDCMQTVFEDGPKRDHRLWLGDLRLQALANYLTYQNYDLVKRSLYILAGTTAENGLVGTCSFERPEPIRGGESILDYTALFAPTVLEYLEASGDRETADDLWPLVLKQLDFTLEPVNEEGLFIPPESWWMFIDWHPTLDKQASEHAIVLYGLRATLKLSEKLGKSAETTFIPPIISLMEASARKYLWDDSLGMFISGPRREVSWASQAWMILAGVPTAEQGKLSMTEVMKFDSAAKPVTPYMHHYFVDALWVAGLREDATRLMQSYWGSMIQKGADTFWEVYIPDDDYASPYGGSLINSYCHAWSCTPTYFLRRETGI